MNTVSERNAFEEWFAFAFGKKPAGNLEQIQEEILDLQHQRDLLLVWEAEHRAALRAWAEKNQRKGTP